jgi:hypothetical protein
MAIPLPFTILYLVDTICKLYNLTQNQAWLLLLEAMTRNLDEVVNMVAFIIENEGVHVQHDPIVLGLKEENKYRVSLFVSGVLDRHVLADSGEEALQTLMDSVLEKDGVTPKKSAIDAFNWEFPSVVSLPAADKLDATQADLDKD